MGECARWVLVPLVVAGGVAGGRPGPVMQVRADGRAPAANPAALRPEIAALLDCGLYDSGLRALATMRQMALGSPLWAPWRRLAPQARASYLSVVNADQVAGLARENAASADLGLALAMAMHGARARDTLVAATGALAPEAAVVEALAAGEGRRFGRRTHAPRDVPVEAVGGLAAKLQALGDVLAPTGTGATKAAEGREMRGRRKGWARRLLLFLPDMTGDGAPVREALAGEIRALERRLAARALALDLRPVRSLGEALSILAIRRLATTPADRLIASLLAAGIVAGAAGVAGAVWLARPIPLAFRPITLANVGESVPTPARVHFDEKAGRVFLRPACFGPQHMPLYHAGDSMALRIAVARPDRMAEALGGYGFVLVTVSERSGIKVFPPATFAPPVGKPPAGADRYGFSAILPLAGPREENKLIVLVRRLRPPDAGRLRRRLAEVYKDAEPGTRINAVVAALGGETRGYLDYSFLSTPEPLACDKEGEGK